ncbi:MAG: signal peptidase [Pseudonocardiales bacterium]|nr:signal peptidase [Pseudonocardiales bacterium]
MNRRRVGALGAMAGIAVVDQAFKWWAWRHAAGVRVNYGGDGLVPSSVGSWYSKPLSGALLDLLDSGLLIVAAVFFLRRRRPAAVLITGAMVIGGWSSNLLDRLFMHYWTAPGSVRGVVDFIRIGKHFYNVADLFIITGTPLLVVAVGVSSVRNLAQRRAVESTHGTAHAPLRPGRSRWARIAVLTMSAQAVTAAVVFGAANFGGASAPVTSVSDTYQPVFVSRHGVAYDLS